MPWDEVPAAVGAGPWFYGNLKTSWAAVEVTWTSPLIIDKAWGPERALCPQGTHREISRPRPASFSDTQGQSYLLVFKERGQGQTESFLGFFI